MLRLPMNIDANAFLLRLRESEIEIAAIQWPDGCVWNPFETAGWQYFLEAQTASRCYNYGVFLERYKNQLNIVCMTGKDFQ